jgi:hypothetical protein
MIGSVAISQNWKQKKKKKEKEEPQKTKHWNFWPAEQEFLERVSRSSKVELASTTAAHSRVQSCTTAHPNAISYIQSFVSSSLWVVAADPHNISFMLEFWKKFSSSFTIHVLQKNKPLQPKL